MFINTKVLSKLMKNAYKAQLKVGCLNDGLVLIGGHWAIWFADENVPNKVKALVIELAGDLPKPGCLFKICKEFPEPQYELVTEDISSIFDGIAGAVNKLNVSPLVLTSWRNTRLLQATDETQSIVELEEVLFSLIDKSEIDLNIEGEPIGPCYCFYPHGPIYWYNEQCKLMVLPVKERANRLFRALSGVVFDDEVLAER